MYTREIEDWKRRLKLTSRQRKLLIGLLLGDAHLESQNKGKTYRLKIEHSLCQKDYVDWLYKEFQSLVRTKPTIKHQIVRGKEHSKYYFQTVSLGSFRFYAQQFYRERKKMASKQIRQWLSPVVMAIWFMDDGSIKSNTHRTVLLNTQGFDLNSIEYLRLALKERYSIHSVIRRQRDGNQIYLLSDTVDIFLGLIYPYVLKEMRYKLPRTWLTKLPKM